MTTSTTVDYFLTAATMRSAFTTKEREDGSTFTACKDGIEIDSDLKKLIRECHDEELPNDWRYETIVSILDLIQEYSSDTEWSDAAYVCADNLTEMSTYRLFQWYADCSGRINYVNEGIDEGLISKDQLITEQLMTGQYLCIQQMTFKIMNALGLID
tara:strand:+ start:310 stop:780 length:471 start_codon:yes stop_codon:yes gene_type:complete